MEPADSSPAGVAASSASTGDVGPGDLVAGKYKIEKLLGEGGMGRVFLARHTMTKKLVALKFLRADLASINDSAGRFMNEARAAVQMESEHVARVIDVDVLPSGVPYMVLEYLEGEDLASLGRRMKRFPPHVAVDYVLEACVAVAEAHAMGIIHRDLKPANLFLTHRKDGSEIVKVLDFGLAKVLEPLEGDPEYAATRAGDILGSPPFMSPEQLTAPETLDVRTDIWSLGIILYKLISGSVPFRGKPSSVRVIQIVQVPHEPLVRVVPDISPDLSAVVDRCLAKEPSGRFPSVGALADALAPVGTAVGRAAADKARRILATAARPSLAGAVEPETLPRMSADLLLGAAPPPVGGYPSDRASVEPSAPSAPSGPSASSGPSAASGPSASSGPSAASGPSAPDALPAFHATREAPSQTSASIEVVIDASAGEDAPTATLWSSSNHPADVPPELRRRSGSRVALGALAAVALGLVALVSVVSALQPAPSDPNPSAVAGDVAPAPASGSAAPSTADVAPTQEPAAPSATAAAPPHPSSGDAPSKRHPATPAAGTPRVGGTSTATLSTKEPPAWPKKGVWGGQH